VSKKVKAGSLFPMFYLFIAAALLAILIVSALSPRKGLEGKKWLSGRIKATYQKIEC
jgi:hypothetical protein